MDGVAQTGSGREAERLHSREVADLLLLRAVKPRVGFSGMNFDCDASFVVASSIGSTAIANADSTLSVIIAIEVKMAKLDKLGLRWKGIMGRAFRCSTSESLALRGDQRSFRLRISLAAFRQSSRSQLRDSSAVQMPVP